VPREDWQGQSERPLRGHVLLAEDEDAGGSGLWRLLLLVLFLAGAIGGALVLYLTPVARVQTVEVTGTRTLDAYTLAEIADLKGSSMFTVPLEEASDRLEALPMVKSARAERRWPHTIRLLIEERQPWAYWHSADTDYVVDADGVVLEGAMPEPDAPVIYYEGSSPQFQPGDILDADSVRLARNLLDSLPTTLNVGVVRLEFSDREGLSLLTDAGYRVVLGDSHSLDYKLAVWQALELKLGRDEIRGQVLDLRFGDRPSLRERGD
jgi:cell division protein FtsQ